MTALYLYALVFTIVCVFFYSPSAQPQLAYASVSLSEVQYTIVTEFDSNAWLYSLAEQTETLPIAQPPLVLELPEQAQETKEVDEEAFNIDETYARYLGQTKKLLLGLVKTRGIWQANYGKLTKADLARLLTDYDERRAN